jgi:hypothetical protein
MRMMRPLAAYPSTVNEGLSQSNFDELLQYETVWA